MTDTEQITLGYMHQYNSMVKDDDFVFDFITKREMRGLDLSSENWAEFGEFKKLMVAISILDGEAVSMLKLVGGIH